MYSYVTGIKKTLKNYAVPFIGAGLVFMQTNCDPTASVVAGISLGTIIAFTQNYFKQQWCK